MTTDYYFHQSDLLQFDFCLERGAALYLDEVPDKFTDSTIYGICIHSGIEATLREKAQGHKILSLADMIEVFGHELTAIIESTPFEWVKWKGPKDLVAMAGRSYAAWLSEVEQQVHPKQVEWKFGRTYDGKPAPEAPPVLIYEDEERRIFLEGQIDCADFLNTLWDWKTSSRPYQPWEKQRWAVQPTVYATAWQDVTGCTWPITFRYAIMLHDGSVQQLVVTRTQEHVEWLRHKLVALARVLESGQRPLPLNDTGWWCSPDWCANWDRCKGSHHGGDDWKKVQKL